MQLLVIPCREQRGVSANGCYFFIKHPILLSTLQENACICQPGRRIINLILGVSGFEAVTLRK